MIFSAPGTIICESLEDTPIKHSFSEDARNEEFTSDIVPCSATPTHFTFNCTN